MPKKKKHELTKTSACSALPRELFCAGSMVPAETPLNIPSGVANLGRAVHDSFEAEVNGSDVNHSEIGAKYKDVDFDEYSRLSSYARKVWREVFRPILHDVTAEGFVESSLFRGREDARGFMEDRTLVILDLKTGRVRNSAFNQGAGYASCEREKNDGIPGDKGMIIFVTIWVRFFEYETNHFDNAALDMFEGEYIRQRGKAEIDKQYAPGEHCTFCPRRMECKAWPAYVRMATQSLHELQDSAAHGVTDEQLVRALPFKKAVVQAAKDYDNVLNIRLESGPLKIDDDTELVLRRVERKELSLTKSVPVLRAEGFTDEDFERAAKMKLTGADGVDTILKEKAPRGLKGKLVIAVREKLDAAGAITKKPSFKRMERKIKPVEIGS